MSKKLAGKRFFAAMGESWKGRGRKLRHASIIDNLPQWARNAFADGYFLGRAYRRPAWTERDDLP